MPSILSLAKSGTSSFLPVSFMRSKSASSTVTFSILIVLSLPPVADAGTTATTLLRVKPLSPRGAALS